MPRNQIIRKLRDFVSPSCIRFARKLLLSNRTYFSTPYSPRSFEFQFSSSNAANFNKLHIIKIKLLIAENKYFEIVHWSTWQAWRVYMTLDLNYLIKILIAACRSREIRIFIEITRKCRSIKTHLAAVESSTRMKSLTEFIAGTKHLSRMSFGATLTLSSGKLAECFRERAEIINKSGIQCFVYSF